MQKPAIGIDCHRRAHIFRIRAPRIGIERALLAFVDRKIFQHDLMTLPVELFSRQRGHCTQFVRQRPELMARGLGFGRDAVEHLKAPFTLGIKAITCAARQPMRPEPLLMKKNPGG